MSEENRGPVLSRRGILAGALAVGLAPVLENAAFARASIGSRVDIGVQLYMLKDLLAKDFEGVLEQVAKTGIRSVEFAGFYDKSAKDIARILKSTGLKAVSAHCVQAEMTDDRLAAMIDFCGELGMPNMCAASPIIRHLKLPIVSMEQASWAVRQITLEDMRESADRFNPIGEKITAAGMRFAYHTHGMDFRRYGEIIAFDDMVQRTDPRFVSFELDIGNAVSARADPIEYLRKYPGRFHLAHVKDWAALPDGEPNGIPASAPFGKGIIDWKKMLEASKAAGINTYFIEQENMSDENAMPALKQGYGYLRSL